jgi:uncharacterized membrane protein
MGLLDQDILNLFCLVWFFSCWIGYTRFAKRRAKQTNCLAAVLHKHRIDWMRSILFRDVRVADASIIANLERNVSFMASTSIFLIAGIMTAMASSDQVHQLLTGLSLTAAAQYLQLKLLILACIFIYAFFTFTWSLRQFGFCSVLIGASPVVKPGEISEEECERFARHSGKVIDQASHSYNYGLRSFYFSMVMLAWFVHPLLFIAATVLVVRVLYQREFQSSSLEALTQVNMDWHAND